MTFQVSGYLLDILVLSLIEKQDEYGYSISQKIKQITDLKESTLYPVLKRLQQAGFLETYNQPFQGRNRKYYHITEQGIIQHKENLHNWEFFKDAVDQMIIGGISHGEK